MAGPGIKRIIRIGQILLQTTCGANTRHVACKRDGTGCCMPVAVRDPPTWVAASSLLSLHRTATPPGAHSVRSRLQVPLLHLHAAATAPVSLALLRLLPPAAPGVQRPVDAARAAEAQQRDYLAVSAEALPDDLRHLGVAAAAWSAQMDSHFQPQQCDYPPTVPVVCFLRIRIQARGRAAAPSLSQSLYVVVPCPQGCTSVCGNT